MFGTNHVVCGQTNHHLEWMAQTSQNGWNNTGICVKRKLEQTNRKHRGEEDRREKKEHAGGWAGRRTGTASSSARSTSSGRRVDRDYAAAPWRRVGIAVLCTARHSPERLRLEGRVLIVTRFFYWSPMIPGYSTTESYQTENSYRIAESTETLYKMLYTGKISWQYPGTGTTVDLRNF